MRHGLGPSWLIVSCLRHWLARSKQKRCMPNGGKCSTIAQGFLPQCCQCFCRRCRHAVHDQTKSVARLSSTMHSLFLQLGCVMEHRHVRHFLMQEELVPNARSSDGVSLLASIKRISRAKPSRDLGLPGNQMPASAIPRYPIASGVVPAVDRIPI